MFFKNYKITNNVFLFFYLLILSFSNLNQVYACEQWVKNFANDYCSDLQDLYNPINKFEKLKKKYHNFIKFKLSKNNEKEINNILIKNIRETCKDNNHFFLRIIK